MKINPNNYFVVQGWMITELNLSGNELMIYAIIHGFSQDGEGLFNGSVEYLASWINASTRTVQRTLTSLCNKGVIIMDADNRNNPVYYTTDIFNKVVKAGLIQAPTDNKPEQSYADVVTNCHNLRQIVKSNDKLSPTNDKLSPNNIVNKKVNKKENNIIQGTSVRKHKNLYQKCQDDNIAYTNNPMLQNVLNDYLNMRLKMKDKPLQYESQWKYLLNRLSDLATTVQAQIEIVQQSIIKGWASFYEVKSYNNSGSKKYHENIEHTDEDENPDDFKSSGIKF